MNCWESQLGGHTGTAPLVQLSLSHVTPRFRQIRTSLASGSLSHAVAAGPGQLCVGVRRKHTQPRGAGAQVPPTVLLPRQLLVCSQGLEDLRTSRGCQAFPMASGKLPPLLSST